MITFIKALDIGPVDLMRHSRGDHIAFRVVQQRPELLRRLVLAERTGDVACIAGLRHLRPHGCVFEALISGLGAAVYTSTICASRLVMNATTSPRSGWGTSNVSMVADKQRMKAA